MSNINWKVRLKQKWFWTGIVPAILVLVQCVLAVFGITADFGTLSGRLMSVIDAVFVVLSILGVVVDPTTSGMSDSEQALSYTEPKTDRE